MSRRNYKKSHSWLEFFQECPYRSNRLRELDVRITTRPMDFGSACHLTIQHYGQHCQTNKTASDLAKLDAIILEAASECILESEQIEELREIMDAFGCQMIFNETSRYEVPLRFDNDFNQVGDEEEAEIGCMIDFLNKCSDHYEIIDYKSDRAIPSDSNPRGKKYKRQLERYGAMVLAADGDESIQYVTATDKYIRYSVESKPVIVTRENYREILDQFKAELEAAENATEYPTRGGDYCTYCPLALTCPALVNLPSENRIIIDGHESACKYAEKLCILKGEVKQLEDAIKAWCVNEGPVTTGSGRMGYFVCTESGYEKPKDIFDMLVRGGYCKPDQIWSNLHLSKSAVEGVIKGITNERSSERKALKKKAEEFLTITTVTKFKTVKENDYETE